MPTRRIRLIITFAAIAVAGTAALAWFFLWPRGVDRVSITSRPAHGVAHCDFWRNGRVEGGHLSGGPRPFVHQRKGKLSWAARRKIWSAIDDLDPETLKICEKPRPDWKAHMQMDFYRQKQHVASFAWRFEGQHKNPKVRAVAELLFKHKIGGW
jgi:hypothetical protein